MVLVSLLYQSSHVTLSFKHVSVIIGQTICFQESLLL